MRLPYDDLLGVAAGVVGTFAMLRKRALMSDALSHSKSPARTAPANHSERVILKTFIPAERIAVISLFL